MQRFFPLILAFSLGLASPGFSDIRVTVRGIDGLERNVGSLHASGDPITISTQELAEAARTVQNPWYSYEFVRIYDTNAFNGGTPTDTVGPVTIDHDAPFAPAQLRVLVAPPPDQFGQNGEADFPFNIDTRIEFPGAKHFRSLDASDLAKKVRCAIAVTHDIGGATADPPDVVNVGQVYRLQARGLVDGNGVIAAGGNIYADVTADMHADGFMLGAFGGFDAVGYVLAGQSLQGTVQATGAPVQGQDLRNSINKIVVGLNPLVAQGVVRGITRDIKAERGLIKTIWCNGPIGTPERNSQIRAGNGIFEVRCVNLDGSGNFSDPAP